MSLPLHQYASAPTPADAVTAHRRLTADLEERVAAATAEALASLGPPTHRWGLAVSALPTTTARATEPHELGAVEVTWSGHEAATGWPALTGRLLVTPQPGRRSRLLFLSRRSPGAELATDRLDRLHRHRVVHVAIGRFLDALARRSADGTTDGSTATRGTTNGHTAASGLAGFDRTPLYVHHLEPLDVDPHTACDRLLDRLAGLASRATDVAVARAREVLAGGRFPDAGSPHVEAWAARPDEPAIAWIRWTGDEEATGWPQLALALLVEAHEHGSRLAVLSPRHPGYDLSRNRVDKRHRDRLVRQAGADVAVALAGELTAAAVATDERRLVAVANRPAPQGAPPPAGTTRPHREMGSAGTRAEPSPAAGIRTRRNPEKPQFVGQR